MAKISTVKKEIGIVGLGDGCIVKENGTKVVFFEIEPSNLAVLSEYNIRNRVMALSGLMQVVGQIEMFTLDARENYSENRAFIKKRIDEEKNPAIKNVLMREERFIKSIEAESSTARIFLLAFSIPKGSETKGANQLEHFRQLANSSALNVRKLSIDEIKTMLAVYYKNDTTTDSFEDFEGQYYYNVDFEELSNDINSGKYAAPIMSFDTKGYEQKPDVQENERSKTKTKGFLRK